MAGRSQQAKCGFEAGQDCLAAYDFRPRRNDLEGREEEFDHHAGHGEEAEVSSRTLAIYLRIWDVHINRIPVSGTIETCRYRAGKFYPAFLNKAGLNEQMIMVISHGQDRFILKQIAGILARRIVCRVGQGSRVEQGERFGLIKLGSRVELTIPAAYEITVGLHQKVRAGETIIARLC